MADATNTTLSSTGNGFSRGLALLGGVGLGLGLMYLLDPETGNRRRARLRDKAIRAANKTGDALEATARDLRNRAVGLAAETRALLTREAAADDVLAERVRARLGRVVSHPGAIEVSARAGRVTLYGPVLAHEVKALLSSVASVRGVTEVDNRLEVHERPGDVPGLQGGVGRPGERVDFLQLNWSPATRFLGATGGALLALGSTRLPAAAAVPLTAAGLTLLARALTNLPLKRLFGVGAGRRAVDVQKTMNLAAPVERVFEFWTTFENFPRFIANVREVRDLGEGRSRWTVAGPAGVPVEWDAVITRLEPNRVLAWKSVPGSAVEHAGTIYFQPNPDGTTRIDIKMSYNPPAGAVGHVVASLFGADPKSEMDEELMRMKTLVEKETGYQAPVRAGSGQASGAEARSAEAPRR